MFTGIVTATGKIADVQHLEKGLRLTLGIPERKGEIARISLTIAQLGGNILALGTFLGDDPTTALVTIKVEDVPAEALASAMRDLGLQIRDIRET